MAVTSLRPRGAPSGEIPARIARNLKQLLDDERWSGRKAARSLGVTQGYISRRTSGDTELSTSDIVMIAGLLKITPEELLEKLLHHDSNVEPIVSQPVRSLDDHKAAKAAKAARTRANPITPLAR